MYVRSYSFINYFNIHDSFIHLECVDLSFQGLQEFKSFLFNQLEKKEPRKKTLCIAFREVLMDQQVSCETFSSRNCNNNTYIMILTNNLIIFKIFLIKLQNKKIILEIIEFYWQVSPYKHYHVQGILLIEFF